MDPRTLRRPVADPVHLAWLRDAGAHRVRHSKRTLLDHLVGTHDLLAAWGAREAVCDAGLFHSAYGTGRLRQQLLSVEQREVVRSLIGAEAERRVWLFHAIDRHAFQTLAAAGRPDVVPTRRGGEEPLADGDLEDLANLIVANAVEQLPFGGTKRRRRTLDLVGLRAHLLRGAVSALEEL